MVSQAKERNYGMILGYPSLGKLPLEERNRYFCDEIHLTAAGNRLLAGDIAKQLIVSSKKLTRQ